MPDPSFEAFLTSQGQARIFLFIREKWNGNSSDSFEGFWEKLESLGQREALS